jgi:hypothetical protein
MNFNYLRINFGEDEAFIVELLRNMIPDIDLKIEELEKCVLQNNPEQCHRLIHNLKASMEMIALVPVIQRLKAIDKEARLGKDLHIFTDNVREISALWELAREDIRKYCEKKAAKK